MFDTFFGDALFGLSCVRARDIRTLRQSTRARAVSKMAGTRIRERSPRGLLRLQRADASKNAARNARYCSLHCALSCADAAWHHGRRVRFGRSRAMSGDPGRARPSSEDARVVSPPLVVHRLQYAFQESTPGGASGEFDDRQRPDLEGLLSCKAWIEPTGHTFPERAFHRWLQSEPAELSGRLPPEVGKTAQAWPLLTVADQALLHTVGEDVAKATQEGLIVQHRLRRVPAFPERASPVHECSHPLRDVREQVLHELREVPLGCSHEQVQVIRGEAEGKELHPRLPHRPREYAPEDVVRPRGWTEKQASLQAAYGRKDDLTRFVPAQRPTHSDSPFCVKWGARIRPAHGERPYEVFRRYEVFDTSRGDNLPRGDTSQAGGRSTVPRRSEEN